MKRLSTDQTHDRSRRRNSSIHGPDAATVMDIPLDVADTSTGYGQAHRISGTRKRHMPRRDEHSDPRGERRQIQLSVARSRCRTCQRMLVALRHGARLYPPSRRRISSCQLHRADKDTASPPQLAGSSHRTPSLAPSATRGAPTPAANNRLPPPSRFEGSPARPQSAPVHAGRADVPHPALWRSCRARGWELFSHSWWRWALR